MTDAPPVKRKPGRPRLDASSKAIRAQVTLDRETIEFARELGNGNLSNGIRRAVRAAWNQSA